MLVSSYNVDLVVAFYLKMFALFVLCLEWQ